VRSVCLGLFVVTVNEFVYGDGDEMNRYSKAVIYLWCSRAFAARAVYARCLCFDRRKFIATSRQRARPNPAAFESLITNH